MNSVGERHLSGGVGRTRVAFCLNTASLMNCSGNQGFQKSPLCRMGRAGLKTIGLSMSEREDVNKGCGEPRRGGRG